MKNLEEEIKANLAEGYINKRISNINKKSKELKENEENKENLKMQRSLKLVLNENKTEDGKTYEKIIKDYIDKLKEDLKKDFEKAWKNEEERLKNVLVKAKDEYFIEDKVIKKIVKILYSSECFSAINLERVVDICGLSRITDTKTFDEKEKSIKELLSITIPVE